MTKRVGVDAEPIEVSAGVQFGLERVDERQAEPKPKPKPKPGQDHTQSNGRGAECEDGRLSSPQFASGSRPSLGDQENGVKRVWEMGYKHLYCRSINQADRSCGTEGNGTATGR